MSSRNWKLIPLLPVGLLLFTAGAYATTIAGVASTTELALPGLILIRDDDPINNLAILPSILLLTNFSALTSELPQVLAAVALAVIGMLVNAFAIQTDTGVTQDMNREVRIAGFANVASGLVGGFPGYHSVTMTQLSSDLTQTRARSVAVIALMVIVVTLLLPSALAFVPSGLPVLVLAYIGAQILITWLWDAWHRLPFKDYLLLLIILSIAVTFGIAAALVVGCLIATIGFTLAYAQIPPVRAQLNGKQRSSSLERSEPDNRRLREMGDSTAIFELQGYLFFGTADRIQTRILSEIANQPNSPDYLIIDFRAVQGVDVSAAQVVARLASELRRNGISLYFSGMSQIASIIIRQQLNEVDATICERLDDALTDVEGRILSAPPGMATDMAPAVTALFCAADEAGFDVDFVRTNVKLGEVIMQQGDDTRSIVVLEDGKLNAFIRDQTGQPLRVASFLPGAIVGEIAYCTGEPRTADIVAATPCRIRIVTQEAVVRLAQVNPTATAAFQEYLSELLAQRLIRTTSVLRALGD